MLPPIQTIHTLPVHDQTNILDNLFEPSPSIHDTLLPILNTEHTTYLSLINACHKHLQTLTSPTNLLSILGSHPRLGEKKITSAHSIAEQANLQRNSDHAQEGELVRLNAEYEDKFPGLRYVVFVNGRGRLEIMDEMRRRIARGNYDMEVDAALQVCSESVFCV